LSDKSGNMTLEVNPASGATVGVVSRLQDKGQRMKRENTKPLWPTVSRPKHTASRIIVPLAVFLIANVFYAFTVRLFAPVTFSAAGAVVGDPDEILPTMRRLTFDGDIRKHLLFSATTAPLVSFIQQSFHMTQDEAVVRVLALIAALNVVGVFILFRSFFSSVVLALLFTLAFAFFFSNLVIFSIPETYALSNLLVVLYLSALLRVRDKLDLRNSLALSLLAGLASLYHPPLLSLLVIHVILSFRGSNFVRWVKTSLANLTLAVVIFLSANIFIEGSNWLTFVADYGGRNFTPQNLSQLVNFFAYSILSPIHYLPHYLRLHDLRGYLQSPLGLVLLPVVLGGLSYAVFVAITRRTEYQRFAWSLLAWISVMVLFYTFYRPDTATLWALHIIVPLLMILAIAFRTLQARPWIRNGVFFLVTVLIALHNSLSLYGGPIR